MCCKNMHCIDKTDLSAPLSLDWYNYHIMNNDNGYVAKSGDGVHEITMQIDLMDEGKHDNNFPNGS